jgi:hypothetical protein
LVVGSITHFDLDFFPVRLQAAYLLVASAVFAAVAYPPPRRFRPGIIAGSSVKARTSAPAEPFSLTFPFNSFAMSAPQTQAGMFAMTKGKLIIAASLLFT